MSTALARLKALQAESPAKAPTVAPLKTLKSPFEPFEGGMGRHVWRDEGQDRHAERLAIALEMGKVAPAFADAFARLQCQSLPGIPADVQTRAADMAGRLLDRRGAELVRLAWPVGAIFDSPLMLAAFGESAALDLRRGGLAWQLREGDTIARLAHDGAIIRQAVGKAWHFQWRPAHGQK